MLSASAKVFAYILNCPVMFCNRKVDKARQGVYDSWIDRQIHVPLLEKYCVGKVVVILSNLGFYNSSTPFPSYVVTICIVNMRTIRMVLAGIAQLCL